MHFLVFFLVFVIRICLCAGVCSHIDAFDLLKGRMRINLGRTEGGMSQKRLDRTDVRAVIEHRRRKRMPQHVRRVLLERRHLPHTRAHDFI